MQPILGDALTFRLVAGVFVGLKPVELEFEPSSVSSSISSLFLSILSHLSSPCKCPEVASDNLVLYILHVFQ